jgi:hypothetical protein
MAIKFSEGVLLALDFNRDEFLCTLFWVYNGWGLTAGDILLGPSIIWEFHYGKDYPVSQRMHVPWL